MTDKTKEALKLALEALESLFNGQVEPDRAKHCSEAITAIREALAEESSGAEQPAQQQEPVAFDVVCHDCGGDGFDRQDSNYRCAVCNGLGYVEKLLYTSPPAQRTWVALTNEERVELMRQVPHLTIVGLLAVEAKIKEKNA